MEVLSESSCIKDNCKSFALVPYQINKILPGFYEPIKTYSFTSILKIKVLQEYENFGVAGVVWEGAKVLGEYLVKNRHLLKDKKVLELGAGTGLAGIVAAKLGAASVLLTDLEKNLDILEKNVALNFEPSNEDSMSNNKVVCSVKGLEWNVDLNKFSTAAASSFDVIIGADLIYSSRSLRSLLKTITFFVNRQNDALVLLSSKARYDHVERFLHLAKSNFHIEMLELDPTTNVAIYQFSSLRT